MHRSFDSYVDCDVNGCDCTCCNKIDVGFLIMKEVSFSDKVYISIFELMQYHRIVRSCHVEWCVMLTYLV